MSYVRSKLFGLGVVVVSLPLATLLGPADASPAGGGSAMAQGASEPSGTTIREVDGTRVVFAYDEVMPDFGGWDRARREPTRGYLSLDRTWRFRYDPEDIGEDEGWSEPGHDDSSWDRIDVPSAWDLADNDGWAGYDADDFGKGGSLRDGYAWYRLDVPVPRDWQDRHVRLNFLAASYRADIWVDGTYVGAHEGGHTAFAVPLDEALRPGAVNTIAVRVHRRPSYTSYDGTGEPVVDDRALPPGPVDLWPYAGLTRSVWLEAVPKVTIAKVLLDTPSTDLLDARVVVENHTDQDFHGMVRIDPGIQASGRASDRPGRAPAQAVTVPVGVPAHGVAVSEARIPIEGAPVWSPESPVLHQARATLHDGEGSDVGGPEVGPAQSRVDTLAATYGVRTFEVDGGTPPRLLLNGEPFFGKGMNWHEETPSSGRSMTRAEYDEKLGTLRELGVNLLRNSVYNRHPYAYDWTDRNGVLVLDEWDTMWVNTRQQETQLEYGLSRALATATAWNQHNHPSVVMWGLQNESTVSDDGSKDGDATTYRAWLADMKAAVHAVDLADRPVTWASGSSWDPAFDIADVVGFNEYFGYFYGENDDLGPTLDAVHETHPDKPILITENGSWAFPPGNRGEPDEVGTEDWQAANLRSHWTQVTERPYVAGYVFWVLEDYKQRANYNMELNGMSGMGLRSWGGEHRRLAFEVFAAATNSSASS